MNTTIHPAYRKLFENEQVQIGTEFVYFESPQSSLKEIPYEQLKQQIIDPLTNKPYKGIVLEGIFADLSQTPNNNKRVYDIPGYLELLMMLKQQIHSKKGVYGELEHPSGYAVNYNNVSHKILDVWYNDEEQKVYGRVLILNTEKGKIAQEIIRSGGNLAISARAAGAEKQNPDGTLKAITKLLVTYDLVYHPGFSSAVLNFKELNESFNANKNGFSGIVYLKDIKTINKQYADFISLNESINNVNCCFLEYYFNLNESKQQKSEEKKQQKIIQKNQSPEENKAENQLQRATENDLKESESKKKMFQQAQKSQITLRKIKSQLDKESCSYYDNSAGFINNENGSFSDL